MKILHYTTRYGARFTIREAAHITGILEGTIRGHMRKGWINCEYAEDGQIVVDEYDLTTYAEMRWAERTRRSTIKPPEEVEERIRALDAKHRQQAKDAKAREDARIERLYARPLRVIKGGIPMTQMKTPHGGTRKHIHLC